MMKPLCTRLGGLRLVHLLITVKTEMDHLREPQDLIDHGFGRATVTLSLHIRTRILCGSTRPIDVPNLIRLIRFHLKRWKNLKEILTSIPALCSFGVVCQFGGGASYFIITVLYLSQGARTPHRPH